jgi:catechol-2,3-dioxygenase
LRSSVDIERVDFVTIPTRDPERAAARAELEARGVQFAGAQDTGVSHMAFCADPDGNTVILHRRYTPYH